MKCPQCRKAIQKSVSAPFCSERCRQLDLAKWLDGTYAIPVEHSYEDEISEETAELEKDRPQNEEEPL
jgi:endogenous inhibitor of DNA gyrase (YacG/DUF329 family)